MTNPALLCADEPAVASVRRAQGDSPLLVVCEHASNRVPASLRACYPDPLLETHYARDIGAFELADAVAAALNATLISANYSRIVIDCNRRLDDPTLVLPVADGASVMANASLTSTSLQQRIDALYVPFHNTVSGELARIEATGQRPIYVAMHSFTPALDASVRPWDVGIMWDTDRRIAAPLIESLASDASISVGDNEPYSGRVVQDFSVDFHAERNGHACVAIEVRQDHLQSEQGIALWAQRLSSALQPIVRDRRLQRSNTEIPTDIDFALELESFARGETLRS